MAAAYGEVTSILYSLESRFFSHAPQILNPLLAIPAAYEIKALLPRILESTTNMHLIINYADAVFNALKEKHPFPESNEIPASVRRNINSLLERVKTIYETGHQQILKDFSNRLDAIDEIEQQTNSDSEFCTPKEVFIDLLRTVALYYGEPTNAKLAENPTAPISAPAL